MIRPALLADIPTMVNVHLRSFPGFFLTFLGSAFLAELYTGILTDPSGIAFVSEEEGQIAGFVAGTSQPAGFYMRLLRQRWWRFAWAAALPAIRQPAIVPRLLRAFSMPEKTTRQEQRGTLMSIGVVPEAQGQGVGQKLVRAFLEEATRRDLHQVDLTTDRKDNEAANRFYQKLGFACERTYVTPEGREMNQYVIDLQRQRSV